MTTKAKPKMILRRVRLADLKPDPRNARTHGEKNLGTISSSLTTWGQVEPLVVQKGTGRIIAGHGRLAALQTLGETECDVNEVDVTDRQADAMALQLNRSGELAGWDNEILAATLQELEGEGYDLGDIGWDESEIDALLGNETTVGTGDDPGPQIDRAAELQEKWGTKTGDLWVIPSLATPGGEHRLLCGDSTKAEDVTRVMGGEQADLLVTSPPYNQDLVSQSSPTGMHTDNAWFHRLDSSYADAMPEDNYQAWQVELMDIWFNHVRDGGAMFYNHKHHYRDRRPLIPLDWIRKTRWQLRQEIIWDRRGGVAANAGMFIPGDERIYWLEKDGPHTWNGIGNNRTTVWPIAPQENNGLHVCPYPLELVTTPIECLTDPGNLIADPFAGSGTTIVAAEQTGRLCRGIEILPAYVAVCLERLTGLGLVPRLDPTR